MILTVRIKREKRKDTRRFWEMRKRELNDKISIISIIIFLIGFFIAMFGATLGDIRVIVAGTGLAILGFLFLVQRFLIGSMFN